MTDRIESARPREFFRKRVERAIARQHVEVTSDSTDYLVTLLTAFVHPEGDGPAAVLEAGWTLAELYCQAVQSQGLNRFRFLKQTGDVALFVSGFFSESLHRKLVDLDYYVKMGGNAYSAAASHSHSPDVAELFDDLAGHFADYVEVVGEVSEECAVANEGNLLRLYEKWRESGSPRTEAALQRAGIIVTPEHLNRQPC
jgi:hypothetical protein